MLKRVETPCFLFVTGQEKDSMERTRTHLRSKLRAPHCKYTTNPLAFRPRTDFIAAALVCLHQAARKTKRARIQRKRDLLCDMTLQFIALQKLIDRNGKDAETLRKAGVKRIKTEKVGKRADPKRSTVLVSPISRDLPTYVLGREPKTTRQQPIATPRWTKVRL